MRNFRLRRPSPALIVASVALFVALGGGAYAAFKLPKGSVGTKQIRNGAVTNSKLGNLSVGTAKMRNGSVTSSKINTSGLTVPNANALGGVAASGYTQAGQSGIFASFKNGPIVFPHTPATIATLSVPAGNYAVFAKYYGNDPTNSPIVTCALSAGGDFDQSVIDLSPADQNASLQLVHTFSATGTIALTCSKDLTTTTDSANFIKITAIRQPSLSNTASP